MKITNVAKIKDNKPYCPKCECELGQLTKNYCSIIHDNKNYTQFERRCDKCGKKFIYQTDITFAETIRYSFEEVTEVKEEGK